MLAGRCYGTWNWPGPTKYMQSLVAGLNMTDKFAMRLMPGSTRVLDAATGKLVNCADDPSYCPHAINGVNHAPCTAPEARTAV